MLALLERFGHGPTSFQTLEQGCSYWFDGPCEAGAAYVDVRGHRVVVGMPVADPAELMAVTARFVAEADQAGRRAVFFGVERVFLEGLAQTGQPHDAVQLAEQPDWQPAGYHVQGPTRRQLRAQLNRARNKGVVVRRVQPEELARHPGSLRAEIELVLDRWLASRRMSVMRFMVDLEPFTFPEARRYYVAEQGDKPVGFLAAVPVFARDGWFFEDVIRVPDAPNGTADLLIHTALEDAREHGDAYVTLGMSPLAGVHADPGRHRLLRRVLVLSRRHLGPLYRFEGVRRFKARFHPDGWTPQFMVVCPPRVGPRAFEAVLRAFAGVGLLSFGFDTVRRGLARVSARWWALGLRLLATLLIPWTVLLALVDGQRWFGDTSIQWAWVSFDTAYCVALFWLARLVAREHRLARAWSMFLAGTTMTDFVLSSVQAFFLHRMSTGWDLLAVLVGIAGPAAATLTLWSLALVAPIDGHRLLGDRGYGERR
jgi:phosphatidylglycerol lysyltransferase